MLARVEHGEVDAGPRRIGTERLCVATRAVKPVAEMIRFVVSPEGAVVPDIKARLPGRGVWVTASRAAVAEAVARKAFGRGFKRDVRVSPELVDLTESLLERRVLEALAMAHKAGRVAAGFTKVEAALATEPVLGLIHASEARPGGVRKIMAAARQRFGEAGPAVIDTLNSAQLDLALGRSNVVHAALLAGPASAGLLVRWDSLKRFRSGTPDGETGAGHGEKGLP
ncbi:MAG TPA: RNA-binding protein [Xanthobacteraceae bacterium]|nr:RNA-binding protein [Xanthobacteraceae bacterium]